METNRFIILEHVTKIIKGTAVLKRIDLTFQTGKIYGMHGTNGSGKTMLLRMIAGLIRPTEGTVHIDGKILHKEMDFPESVGVVIETPDFWQNYTGMQVLQTLAEIQKKASPEDLQVALQRVGLVPGDKRTVKKYSLGMKQRLGIAQAIMERPKILLLDEPTNALDKTGVLLVKQIIKEEAARGAVVVIASHSAGDLRECDVLLEIEDGCIISRKEKRGS